MMRAAFLSAVQSRQIQSCLSEVYHITLYAALSATEAPTPEYHQPTPLLPNSILNLSLPNIITLDSWRSCIWWSGVEWSLYFRKSQA